MISTNYKKILSLMLVFVLIGTNFYILSGGMFGHQVTSESTQPYYCFNDFKINGQSDQENERYGWNISYIDNLNGDNYPDLVISSPWFDNGDAVDSGAVYIFYGTSDTSGSSFSDLSPSAANAKIVGHFDSDHFGWAIADAEDINNDGINDLVVGAPGASYDCGRVYIFYGGSFPSGNYEADVLAARIITGSEFEIPENGMFGSSVLGLGDLNNDGYGDVMVGAPGVDKVIIAYGFKNRVTKYIDLWDDDHSTKNVVCFDNGVNNTVNDLNTWGINGDDDGWDWIDSFADPDELYGQTAGATHDHVTIYSPWEASGPDADGLTYENKSSLEIMVGRNHTDYNPYYDGFNWDPGASGAWGIEFKIDNELYNYISKNSSIQIGFDFSILDALVVYNNSNLSRNYVSTIRSRIWNGSVIDYMGNEVVNGEKYVFYKQATWNTPPFGPVNGRFEYDITDYIDHSGSYYWDFGVHLDQGWSFRADDALMAFFDNITMKVTNDRYIEISGVTNSQFGTAMASLGDINTDGYTDVLISGPDLGPGTVALFHGKQRLLNHESVNTATVFLIGENDGDKFGYSIANAGDLDNDGIADIAIGAPGGNYAHVYYGKTLKSGMVTPNLWELPEDAETPIIEFDSGIDSSGNTPGITGADDGWEIWNGVYGYQSGATAGSSVRYNGANSLDTDQIGIDNRLSIAIGGNHGGGSTGGAKPDSGAYGLEFKFTKTMASAIKSGERMILSYDWSFENIGLDQDDTVWIKTFIRDNNNIGYSLGWDLDKSAGQAENKDESNETHWAITPESTSSIFIQDITNCFTNPGSYYLDLGAKLRNYWWDTTWEDGLFYFDNLYLRINPKPDLKFIGPDNSSFGFCVGCSKKLNLDEKNDIIIGAPNFNSENGDRSGAVYGFITKVGVELVQYAENAEFISYGETAGENFGWCVLGIKSVDDDEFDEILASSVNFDSSVPNAGKVYLLSINKGPKIWMINPMENDLLSGVVKLNATVIDPDNNIDTTLGVYIYYSIDKIDWELMGNILDPVNNNLYEYYWNTSEVSDGSEYHIKCWVQDLELNKGESITGPITINNPHPPELKLKYPQNESTVSEIVEVKVSFNDSELDTIDGGINTSNGVKFYYSEDNSEWNYIAQDVTGKNDIYTASFNTWELTDGEYWIKVNGSDLDGFKVEDQVKIYVDNPGRRPSIELLSQLNLTELNGKVKLSASVFDYDGDVNGSGVTFFVSPMETPDKWEPVCSAKDGIENDLGLSIYTTVWDTNSITDNWYKFKAVVNDTEGLVNETTETDIVIHNTENNAPVIELISPDNGKIVDVSQIISVRVRDLENNIDANGVFFSYSNDGSHWHYLGNTAEPRVNNEEYFDYLWATDLIADGKYWLNVSVTDKTDLTSWEITDEPVIVHNSLENPPQLKLITPKKGSVVKGEINLSAWSEDMENNIDKTGVTFSVSSDKDEWIMISNVATPGPGNVYTLAWDTNMYSDGKYWLKVDVTDFDGLNSVVISDHFYIHNRLDNKPEIELISPNSGTVNNTIKINVTVFDLEQDFSADGVKFYYSDSENSDNWTLIDNDRIGNQIDDRFEFSVYWDTTRVPDNFYWLKVSLKDKINAPSKDISDNYIIVHNKDDNPPQIKFIAPLSGNPLASRESIVVEIFDFEDDVNNVVFLTSVDKQNWELIGQKGKPDNGLKYRVVWSTELIENNEYYIKVRATDKMGNTAEIVDGPFAVTQGIPANVEDNNVSNDNNWFMVAVLIMVVVTIIVITILILIKRSKKREEELIKEVAAEVEKSRKLEGELEIEQAQISSPSITTDPSLLPPILETDEPTQTYIPPPTQADKESLSTQPKTPQLPAYESEPDVETVEAYKKEMYSWKSEGFNVSRLENIYLNDESKFVATFPIFSSQIAKLKRISNKLSSLDTVGYEDMVNSIRSKLYDPDQAAVVESEFRELESSQAIAPMATRIVHNYDKSEIPSPKSIVPQVAPEPESVFLESENSQPVQLSEVPPDVDLPPEYDLPEIELPADEAIVEPEIPESPYANLNVKIQSLDNIKIPDDGIEIKDKKKL